MKYYILKPKKLNLENLVDIYQPDFKFNLDKAYLIIYLVIKLSNKKNNSNEVRLSSKMLQSMIGYDYNKYIKFLLENYLGHGNEEFLARERLFERLEAQNLNNK